MVAAASSPRTNPTPSSANPAHARPTIPSPSSVPTIPTHTRPDTGSRRTNRTHSATSIGARYSSSSATPTDSRDSDIMNTTWLAARLITP